MTENHEQGKKYNDKVVLSNIEKVYDSKEKVSLQYKNLNDFFYKCNSEVVYIYSLQKHILLYYFQLFSFIFQAMVSPAVITKSNSELCSMQCSQNSLIIDNFDTLHSYTNNGQSVYNEKIKTSHKTQPEKNSLIPIDCELKKGSKDKLLKKVRLSQKILKNFTCVKIIYIFAYFM